MKLKINNHASVVIAYRGNEIFSNIYDFTYPKKIWQGRINLLGGGQDAGDKSPQELLKREINEEFKIKSQEVDKYDTNFQKIVGNGQGAPKIEVFASNEDITLVKNELLGAFPWKDFLVTLPSWKGDLVNVIFSVYIVELSAKAMEIIKKNISQGKSLVSEGFLRVTSLDDMSSGKLLSAWAAGVILSQFFKKDIPNPENIGCKEMGIPRLSMQDYFNEFDYVLK